MKILIICQKVDDNDDLLGAFMGWIREFAKKVDEVRVICLYKGSYNLPPNVQVFSLGKERGVSRIGRWFNFYATFFKILPKFDVIFSHMCPIYAIAASPARLFGKRNTMWYAHGQVSLTLRLSIFLSNLIFTSSKKGCRVKSDKIRVVGQGVDTDLFAIDKNVEPDGDVLTVGRISPSKHLEILIEAADLLIKNQRPNLKVKIIGQEGLPSQRPYFDHLRQLVKEKGLESNISFPGAVANRQTVGYYQKSRLFVNMSTTGSLDRAVLEAMSCGLPVLTCNEAYEDILERKYLYEPEDFRDLAKKIDQVLKEEWELSNRDDQVRYGWRSLVLRDHSLNKLIDKILNCL